MRRAGRVRGVAGMTASRRSCGIRREDAPPSLPDQRAADEKESRKTGNEEEDSRRNTDFH
jgi:hypothetical protein